MKYFLSLITFCFIVTILSAQEKHFVFLQSDTKQPFYVSVSGKLYSSSASGYLIIPKLAEGSYNFTFGFAQNAFPEQSFTCTIKDKDLGFELKNFSDKGWGLFNLQTLDITMASAAASEVVAKALSERPTSNVAKDVITFDRKKEQEKSVDKPTVPDVVNGENKIRDVKEPLTNVSDPLPPGVKNSTTLPTEQVTKTEAALLKQENASSVKKVSEVSREEGVHLSYVETSGKTTDTIKVIIPSATVISAPESRDITVTPVAPAASEERVANKGENGNLDNGNLKFLDISLSEKKDSIVTPGVNDNNRIYENSNCKNIATDEDYVKLRKKMAGETTDEKMISEAKKFYRNKCFTTNQIKSLSTLFLSDEGRFKFFDASFVSVADASLYTTLQTEFIDPEFVSRFKELIK